MKIQISTSLDWPPKAPRPVCLAVIALFFQSLAVELPAQGNLNPSVPPGITFRTLDEVEPRTIVNAANTPGDADHEFIISQPGSYYLTRDVLVAKTNGILVDAPNVVLDLNGFRVWRNGGAAGRGIVIDDPDGSAVTVRNGTIGEGFEHGLTAFRTNDVSDPPRGAVISGLNVTGVTKGIRGGEDWVVENCSVTNLSGDATTGILLQTGGVITNCTVGHLRGDSITGVFVNAACTLNNVTIRDLEGGNVLRGIGGNGACVLRDVVVTGLNGTSSTATGIVLGSNSILSDVTVQSVSGFGLTAGYNLGNNSVITDCAATNIHSTIGPAAGIHLASGVAENCAVNNVLGQELILLNINEVSGGIGIFAENSARIINCRVRDANTAGISVENNGIVSGCSVEGGASAGIWAQTNCVIRDCAVAEIDSVKFSMNNGILISSGCQVVENTVNGLLREDARSISVAGNGNRIDGNHISNCEVGIAISGAQNLTVRNSVAQFDGQAYDIGVANETGEIISGPTSVSSADLDPWVNFRINPQIIILNSE